MIRNYYLDTNVIIDLLTQKLHPESQNLLYYLHENLELAISKVVRAVLFSKKLEVDEKVGIERFLSQTVELPLMPSTANMAGIIRATFNLKLPDAMIAATALELESTLVSSNSRCFKRVEGLQIKMPERSS